eukprot:comp17489_c0_seq1/m.16997 comp17489_c0_seq1/g.16997  ORF comp17489_c0_seq1/g.16997 comp17489_c0_seq1/m.16997 type:complete len:276 (-) comp17489_c0_seq1:176-1003(-)
MAHLRPAQKMVGRPSAHAARTCLLLVRHQTNGSGLDWTTFLNQAGAKAKPSSPDLSYMDGFIDGIGLPKNKSADAKSTAPALKDVLGSLPKRDPAAKKATGQPSESARHLVQVTSQQPISKRQNKSSPNFPLKKNLDLENQSRLNIFSDNYGQGETAEEVHRQQLQERLAFQAAYQTEDKALNTLKKLLQPRFNPNAFTGTTEEDKKARAMGYKEIAGTLTAASKGVPNNDWRQAFLAHATSAVSRNPSLSLSARQAMVEAIKAMPAAPQAPARR